MVQVPHRVEHPGLVAAVLRRPSGSSKNCVAHGLIGRRRAGITNTNRALRSGFLKPRRAAVSRIVGASATSRTREVERQIGLVGFGERQPGNLHLAPPDAVRATPRVSVVVATLRSAPNHAAFWLVVAARVEAGAQHRLELRRDRDAIVGGREPPEHRAHVVEHLLDVELVGFARQRGEQLVAARARARTRPSSIASHSATSAAPRVSGSVNRVQRRRQEVERRAIEIEEAVAEPAADGSTHVGAGKPASPRARPCRRRRERDVERLAGRPGCRRRTCSCSGQTRPRPPRILFVERRARRSFRPPDSSSVRDRRPSAFLDPGVAPRREVRRRARVERC